jgi:MSHA biogenesis protein MshO
MSAPSQPMGGSSSDRGFTLIELVVTIAVSSVVVSFMTMFIVMPMNAYTAQTRRASLVDASDSALRFMARDIRSALPNSVRVTAGGTVTALELLATADGARYQDNGSPALALDFTQPDGAFSTTVPRSRGRRRPTTSRFTTSGCRAPTPTR